MNIFLVIKSDVIQFGFEFQKSILFVIINNFCVFISYFLENCFQINSPVDSFGEKVEFSEQTFRKLKAKEKSMCKLFLQEYEKASLEEDTSDAVKKYEKYV